MHGKSSGSLAIYVAMCAAAFCAHSHALAAGTAFPSGGGDISTAADWGLEDLPTGDVTLPLGYQYTSTNNVAFSTMEFSGGNHESTLAISNGVTVSLNGNTETDLKFGSSGQTMILKGGAFSVQKGSRIGYTSSNKGNTLVLDGCSFSHLGSILKVGASVSPGNAVILTNNATAALHSLELCNNGSHGNRFEVNAGCTVTAANNSYTDSFGTCAADDGSLLLVRGAGASFSVANGKSFFIGMRHENNEVRVEDGASFSVPGTGSIQFGPIDGWTSGISPCGYSALNVFNSATVSSYYLTMGCKKGSGNNTVTISNATVTIGWQTLVGGSAAGYGTNTIVATGSSTVFTAGRLRIGGTAADAPSDRNVVMVLDGAKLTSLGDTRIGGSGSFNEVIVSNATMQAASLTIGQLSNASNNALRIMGPSAKFTLAADSWGTTDASGCFGNGDGGLLEYSDHCSVTFSHANSSVIGNLSNGNVVRMTGGASVKESVPVVGRPARDGVDATTGNRLEVLDGATYSIVRLFAKGVGNGVVVSNATVLSSNSQTNTFIVGEVFAADGDLAEATSNNYIRLEGETPRIYSSDSGAGYRIWNRSRVEFALPATPYAEAPLKGCQLHLDDSSDFVFDFSALDAVQHGRMKFRLFEASTSNDGLKNLCSASAIARANASLAERGASLAWEGSGIGATLVLTVPGNYGMLMLLK